MKPSMKFPLLAIVTLLTYYFTITNSGFAQTANLPMGFTPTVAVLPSGNYVVAYRNLNHYLDILEFDASNNITNQYTVFDANDPYSIDNPGINARQILYPKIIPTGLNSYEISAWREMNDNYPGFIITQRSIGSVAPLVKPTPTISGSTFDNLAVSNDGKYVFSTAIWGGGDGNCNYQASCSNSYAIDAWFGYFGNTDVVQAGTVINSGPLNSNQTGYQFSPKVISISGGAAFLSVWYECQDSDNEGSFCLPGSDLKARVYEPNYFNPNETSTSLWRNFWGPEVDVNITTAGNQGTYRGSAGKLQNETFAIVPFYYDSRTGNGRVLIAYLSDQLNANSFANVAALGVIFDYNSISKTLTRSSTSEILLADSTDGNVNFVSALRLSNGSVLIGYTKDQNGLTAFITKVIDSNGTILQPDTTIVPNVGSTDTTGRLAFPQMSQVNNSTAKVIWQENAVYDPLNSLDFRADLKMMDFSIGTASADSITVP